MAMRNLLGHESLSVSSIAENVRKRRILVPLFSPIVVASYTRQIVLDVREVLEVGLGLYANAQHVLFCPLLQWGYATLSYAAARHSARFCAIISGCLFPVYVNAQVVGIWLALPRPKVATTSIFCACVLISTLRPITSDSLKS